MAGNSRNLWCKNLIFLMADGEWRMKDFEIKSAIIDPVKLRDYCLSPEHPRGKHKARVFHSVLGLTQDDWNCLGKMIRANLATSEWVYDGKDQYGRKFHVDMQIHHLGRSATIRTLWIVRNVEQFPRLTSCFVHP